MGYQTKTYEELVELEKASIRNRIPESDTSDGSDYDIEARVHATVVHGNQAQGTNLARQVLPQTADGDYLVEHANRVGIPRRAAQVARGVVALVPTTGNTGTQGIGSTVATNSGVEYTTDEGASITLPPWTGKTVGGGLTLTRIPVLPDVDGISAGDRIQVTTPNGVEDYTVERVLVSIQAIEIYGVMSGLPTVGSAITARPSATVPVTAVLAGATGNRRPNEAGVLDGPVPPVSADMVFLEVTGGSDQQKLDEFRRDTIAATASRPASGNLEHWRRWVVETPTVGMETAFIYPGLRGLGTMTAVPFGVAGARRIGDERNAEIRAHVLSQDPALDDFDLAPLSQMGSHEDVEATVEAGVGSEPDWKGSFSLRATAPLSTSTRLQAALSTDLALLQIGDRVVVTVLVDGRQVTEERAVSGLVNAGANDYRVELDAALSSAPEFAYDVTPGGPLYEPMRAAVQAMFDGLGPGDTEPASRWPRVSDSYPARLTISGVSCAIQTTRGVDNVFVTEPSEDRSPLPLHYFTLGRFVVTWL